MLESNSNMQETLMMLTTLAAILISYGAILWMMNARLPDFKRTFVFLHTTRAVSVAAWFLYATSV